MKWHLFHSLWRCALSAVLMVGLVAPAGAAFCDAMCLHMLEATANCCAPAVQPEPACGACPSEEKDTSTPEPAWQGAQEEACACNHEAIPDTTPATLTAPVLAPVMALAVDTLERMDAPAPGAAPTDDVPRSPRISPYLAHCRILC